MKTFTKVIATLLILITINLITINYALAQEPPPPPPPGHNSSGNVPGGGAPIAGGIGIFLALGAGYGIKRIYNWKKNKTTN